MAMLPHEGQGRTSGATPRASNPTSVAQELVRAAIAMNIVHVRNHATGHV